MERIPADSWADYTGHTERYRYAAARVLPGETVNDVACGVGYGSTFFEGADYHGYDRAGVPSPEFPGTFHAADLDDPRWSPRDAHVTVCFETLEHVKDPAALARVLAAATSRAIIVSVPVVPTVAANPYHLHDFTRAGIPPLFPGFRVAEEWPQPSELSHVWLFCR